MRSLIPILSGRVIGTVEEVYADRIVVLLDREAPQATAFNTSSPMGFPRINGHVLIPNESGATACLISSIRIERLPLPKHRGIRGDTGLVDLPFPSRVMNLTPIGTLTCRPTGDDHDLLFEVRRGVDVFPSVGDQALLPDIDQLKAIVEGENSSSRRIVIGHCPTAGRAPVHVDPDKLFGRHLAVLGNTGAGKSCSVAGLVRWSLAAATADRKTRGCSDRPNARFVVLDPNGEYTRSFHDLGMRLFRVEPETATTKPLHVPAWLWNGAEWAAFTGAAPGAQRPVLFEALRRLRSGGDLPSNFDTETRGRIHRYRNNIAVSVQSGEHMKRGKREGVAMTLLNISKDFRGLSERPECADKPFKELLKKISNKAEEVEQRARSGGVRDDGINHWHNNFTYDDIGEVAQLLQDAAEKVGLSDSQPITDAGTPISFKVRDLPGYVEALAADQSGRDIAQFVDTLNLRIRSLLTGTLSSIIKPDDETVTLENWLDDYVGKDQARDGPVAVVDLSLVPVEVIHVVVSVLARMIFEALQRYRRKHKKDLPTTLVLEEAHTFIHRELSGESASPASRECANVFERISREGRKFGLGLVLASQRPSEISPTVLSQCNTFLLHRLVNDRDQELVKRLVPDGLGPILRDLPSLPTRRAILLGWAAPAPTLVEVQEIPEDKRPRSPDPAFWSVWTGQEQRAIDWKDIVKIWQRQNNSKK